MESTTRVQHTTPDFSCVHTLLVGESEGHAVNVHSNGKETFIITAAHVLEREHPDSVKLDGIEYEVLYSYISDKRDLAGLVVDNRGSPALRRPTIVHQFARTVEMLDTITFGVHNWFKISTPSSIDVFKGLGPCDAPGYETGRLGLSPVAEEPGRSGTVVHFLTPSSPRHYLYGIHEDGGRSPACRSCHPGYAG